MCNHYMLAIILLVGLKPMPCHNLDQFEFMKKLFKKCNNPNNQIDAVTPILAKGIAPTLTISELCILFQITNLYLPISVIVSFLSFDKICSFKQPSNMEILQTFKKQLSNTSNQGMQLDEKGLQLFDKFFEGLGKTGILV